MTTAPQFSISSAEDFGDAPFFIFCDHASNAIPAELDCLGLPSDILQTHIAWDIGAGALARVLAQRLGGRLFQCGFSRLVIDVNRDVTSHDLIPTASDQIPVPGNQMLTEAQRRQRISDYHDAYHARLSAGLDVALAGPKASAGTLFAVSVHSFTNRLMGAAEDRPWPVGVLWRDDEQSAQLAITALAEKTGWPIGDNEPYDARVFNYSVDRHIAPRGLPHLTLEIRQDVIGDAPAIMEMADHLTDVIRSTAAARHNKGDAS